MRIEFTDFHGNYIGFETPAANTPAQPLNEYPHLGVVLLKRLRRTQDPSRILKIADARLVDDEHSRIVYEYPQAAVSLAVLELLSTQEARSMARACLTMTIGAIEYGRWAFWDMPVEGATTPAQILTIRPYVQHSSRIDSIVDVLGVVGCSCRIETDDGDLEIFHITPRSLAALRNIALTTAHVLEELSAEYAPPPEETIQLPAVPDFTAKTNRRFGIEFEFISRPSHVSVWDLYSDELNRVFDNVRVTEYEHSDGTCWHFKPDSSCGFELASPALTWDLWEEVENAVRLLHRCGARVTHTCGLHVHHELSDFSVVQLRRLVVLWATFEDVIFGLVDAQRANNRYCLPLKTSLNYQTWDSLVEPLGDVMQFQGLVQHEFGRYRALNCTGWWNHGRVEMRLLEGTLDINLVKFWVFITQRFVEIAKNYNDYAALSKAYNARGIGELENMFVRLLEMDLTEDQREVFRSLWKIRYKKPNRLPSVEYV